MKYRELRDELKKFGIHEDPKRGKGSERLFFHVNYEGRGYRSIPVTCHGEGKYDGAMADYTEAIRLDLKYAAAYNNRGELYQALNLIDKAKLDFQKVLSLVPFGSPEYKEAQEALAKL